MPALRMDTNDPFSGAASAHKTRASSFSFGLSTALGERIRKGARPDVFGSTEADLLDRV